MWRGKHFRNKKDKYARSMYVKWRNKVVKLLKISIQNYFDRRCNEKHNPRDFYKTVCPFLSDKPSSSNGKIILCDNGNIISDPSHVANIFNMYYSAIAAYSGIPDGLDCLTLEDAVLKHALHESITLIKQHTDPCQNFQFRTVSYDTFQTYVDQLKSDKTAGFDGLQAKFLKLSGYKYICCLCDVFNKCVCTNVFPSYMKLAEISPIYKKDDNLRKENYRSVHLLIMISKVFERILADQLIAYFENLSYDNIISDPSHVANIFNMYYSAIAAYSGIPDGLDCLALEDAVLKHALHESITLIKQHTDPCQNFQFRTVSYDTFKTFVVCVMFSTSVSALMCSLHIWNLLK